MNIKFVTTTDSTHIKLIQQGTSLYVAQLLDNLDQAEQTVILEVTQQEVALEARPSGTIYRISGAAYWRAWHGSVEPDLAWAGMMEAQAALSRQEANIEETLLLNSTPMQLRQPDLVCAFGPFDQEGKRQDCSNMATLVHITEDINRTNGYVVLPICERCNEERLRAKYAEPQPDERDNIAYPIGVEG